MGITAINIGNGLAINISELAIFIPIIVLNTMAYYKQKDKLKKAEPKVEIIKRKRNKKSI